MLTHIRNDDSKLWVECVVHLADCSFVTPEGVVVLTILGVWVTYCGEHLVPRCGIGVCLWHAVWWLPTNQITQSDVDWCGTAHITLVMEVTEKILQALLNHVLVHLDITHIISICFMFNVLILEILKFHRTGMIQNRDGLCKNNKIKSIYWDNILLKYLYVFFSTSCTCLPKWL